MHSHKRQRETFSLSQCKLNELPTDSLTIETEYDVLHRLLELLPECYSSRNPKEQRIPEPLILLIISVASSIIAKEPILVELSSPIYVCGDLHGQYYDLINIFHLCPPLNGRFIGKQSIDKKAKIEQGEEMYKFLFLGDYVDRGARSIEVMVTLMALKIIMPSHITLLRGNHEDEQIMLLYGFFDECKRRYSIRLFKTFTNLFRVLPVAATINGSIFCVHGGISSELKAISNIPDPRPFNVPHSGAMCDLLWADPEDDLPLDCDFSPSPRRISFVFSERALAKFLHDNNLSFVCRAHQVVEEGFRFFPTDTKRHLLTIFSATNYCNEFGNRGGILKVNEEGVCSIIVLQPPSDVQKWEINSFKDPLPSEGSSFGDSF